MKTKKKHLLLESENLEKNDMCFGYLPFVLKMIKNIQFNLLALFMLLFVGDLSFGQTTVTIGAGVTTTSLAPIAGASAYSYSQSLYLSSESSLSTYSGQYITSVAFYWSGTGTINCSNVWDIYIGNTSKSTFSNTSDWVASTSMSQVFSGTVALPGAAGWMTLTLQEPFLYTGGNIVVAVDDNKGGTCDATVSTWRYSVVANTYLYKSNAADIAPLSPGTGTSFNGNRPNIQFVFQSLTNNVNVTATAGTTTGSYYSLRYACDAINNGIHSGDITIELGTSNNQTISAPFQTVINASGAGSANYTSVLIRPAYSNITVTSSLTTAATIQLNLAQNVTIDGRIGSSGTTKDLTIENSGVGSSKGAVDFVGASNNTIRYCTLKSSTTSTTGGYGTISMNFSGTSGSSNNLIEYCEITKSGANWPWVAIASSATSNTYYCQSNTVRYCTISDFKRAGIWLGTNNATTYNNLWTIDNNTFYESASFGLNTTDYGNYAICIGYRANGIFTFTNRDYGTHTISNNSIGGNGSGGNWTIVTTANTSNFVAPIYVAASDTSNGITVTNRTKIYGNTIKDFSVQTHYFSGIFTHTSKVKVGDTTSGYGNIIYNIALDHNSGTAGGTAAGIYVYTSGNNANMVSGNTIYDMNLNVGLANFQTFYGAHTYSGSSTSTDFNNRNKVYNISLIKTNYGYGMYMNGNCELNHVSKIKFSGNFVLYGLYWVCTGSGNAANYRVENNEIILGLDKDGNATASAPGNDIIGLYIASQYAYVYYNTVLIQGSSSSERSACLRLNFTGAGATIKNNLLYNNRTGGGGTATNKHMCISSAVSSAANLMSSNNAYIKGPGATNYVGDWLTNTSTDLSYSYAAGGAIKSALNDWVAAATSENGNSIGALSTDANRDIATMFPSANGATTSTSYNLLPNTPDKWLCHGIDVTPKNDFSHPLSIVRPNGGNPGDTTTIGAYEISCNTVLPVELLSFESSCTENGQVKLLWSTASETNNNYFTIEKSHDGVSFEPVIRVEGAGNSNQLLHYNATDDEPSAGPTYYRLRQTDFDGSISYSEIISADCSQNQFSLSISPNPVWEHIDIYISGTDIQSIKISMINCIGQEIAIISTIADNKILVSFPEEIPAGQYIIKVSNDDNLKTCKILKM